MKKIDTMEKEMLLKYVYKKDINIRPCQVLMKSKVNGHFYLFNEALGNKTEKEDKGNA